MCSRKDMDSSYAKTVNAIFYYLAIFFAIIVIIITAATLGHSHANGYLMFTSILALISAVVILIAHIFGSDGNGRLPLIVSHSILLVCMHLLNTVGQADLG